MRACKPEDFFKNLGNWLLATNTEKNTYETWHKFKVWNKCKVLLLSFLQRKLDNYTLQSVCLPITCSLKISHAK